MADFLYKVQTRFLFHADIRVKIPAWCTDGHFDALFDVLATVDRRYNSYQKGSYFDLINQHAGSFVTVDDETIRLLRQAMALSEFFNGRYAITIMPLIRQWGFYHRATGTLPAPAEIQAAQTKVNDQQIEIRGNDVRIGPHQEIVTGSFIKAYAVDRLLEKLRQMQIDDAVINAGGSTIAARNHAEHPFWQVSVDLPATETEYCRLNLTNQVYSTSAQGDSFVEIGGQRYGHILNPQTGFPSTNLMVGIVTESAMLGDMLSTGLFNETADTFLPQMERLQQHYPLEGFLMDEHGKVMQTRGLSAHIVLTGEECAA